MLLLLEGGLGQLTKALSNEWAQHNIQVNAIAPGYIATDMYVLRCTLHLRANPLSPQTGTNASGKIRFAFDRYPNGSPLEDGVNRKTLQDLWFS